MSKDVSILFKAVDRVSEPIKGMRGGVQSLEKDVQSYGKTSDRIFKERSEVKLDIDKAKRSLKELSKAVKDGAEGADEAYKAQAENLDRLNEKYKSLGKQMKETDKMQKDLFRTSQKIDNGTNESIVKTVMASGAGKMLYESVGDIIGYGATSILGQAGGNAISNIASGVTSGAALGSIIPGIGTAVGAAVGGVTGAIQSLTQQLSEKDSYYKEEVQNLYNDATADLAERITSGSAIAAERETYQRGFEQVLGEEAGNSLYQAIKEYGDTTAYDTTTMFGKGAEMLTYGIAGEDVMGLMEIIGDIAGGDTTKFSGLSYAISQSMAAGKLNAQDKNQMVGYGFNPLEFIAKMKGISVSEATDMMSDGKISSDMLMEALEYATSEGQRFYGATDALSDTYDSMKGQLESAWSDMEAAAGEGYNNKRKEGMSAEIEQLEQYGDEMKAAYEMVGAYEAEMENQHQENIVRAMQEAAKRIEEEGLEGAEAEKVMWEAKTQAEIDYKNSEEYQMKLAAEKSLVENIQSSLTESDTYWNFGYEMAQEFSKGYQSGRLKNGVNDAKSVIASEGVLGWVDSLFDGKTQIKGHATGLQRVPYDGYIAKLHEGEQVLTRTEANQRSGGIVIVKLADQITVREEADIDKITTALVKKLMDANESYVGA